VGLVAVVRMDHKMDWRLSNHFLLQALSLAYYPFGLRLILGKLAADEESLELEDPIHPSCLANARRTRLLEGGPQSGAPCSGGSGKAGGSSDPVIDGEADGLKRRSSKTPAGCARR
jgi:hypothetical protein